MKTSPALLSVAFATLFAVGCGSSGSDDDPAAPTATSGETEDDGNASTTPKESASGTVSDPDDDPLAGPTLRLESRDAVLADVLRVLNAEPIDEMLATLPVPISSTAAPPAGSTRLAVSDDATDLPPDVPKPAIIADAARQDEPSASRRTDYRRDAGGTATVLFDRALLDSPPADAFAIRERCTVDGATFDGATRTRFFARPFVEHR